MAKYLKSDKPKVKVNIAFPEPLIEKLRVIAERENRSLNMQVITILQKYVESNE